MSLLDDLAADIANDAVFYDTEGGFAETATATGGDFPILFENDYFDLDIEGGGVAVAGSEPRAWCRSTEAPAIGATVTVRTVNFTIVNARPNTDGETFLLLQEV